MRNFRVLLPVVLSLGVAACADHDLLAFDSAVSEASADVVAHRAAIATAPSMAGARSELTRHEVEIDADLRHMRSHLDDLGWGCDDRDLDYVWNKLYAVEDRVDIYLAGADAMADMTSLRIVCNGYADDMDGLLDELRDRMDAASCW